MPIIAIVTTDGENMIRGGYYTQNSKSWTYFLKELS